MHLSGPLKSGTTQTNYSASAPKADVNIVGTTPALSTGWPATTGRDAVTVGTGCLTSCSSWNAATGPFMTTRSQHGRTGG